MASLIEELIDVLEETTGCYKELLVMANNKKDVIIKGDVPSLQTLTEEEQGVAGRLLRLEKKRQQLINDISSVTNKDPETMTVAKVVDMLSRQPKEQKQLKEISIEMITHVNKMKVANDLNKRLLEESLDYVDFTMNAIHSIADDNQSNSYEKKGNRYDSYSSTNFFDAKQ